MSSPVLTDSTALPAASGRGSRIETAVAWGAVLLSGVVLARSAFTRPPEDVSHYFAMARSVAEGARPYADTPCEYPPYALAWLLWPSRIGNAQTYTTLLSLSFLAWHLWATALVLREGERLGRTRWTLGAALALSALPVLQGFWYLRRFDAIPAALAVIALVAAGRAKRLSAGLALAVGALSKVFPILLAPVLLASAIRTRTVRPLALGACLGAIPALMLLLVWPWWRFADLHITRGLQVESLPASLLWLGRHVAGWDLRWVNAAASYEIHGRLATLVLPWSRAAWAITTVASSMAAGCRVSKEQTESPTLLARSALLPVLAFVAWSPVLSPQFMIWLQVLAAMALLESGRLVPIVLLLSAAATPMIYPCGSYRVGLDLVRTAILVARNLALVIGWGLLMWEAVKRAAVRPSRGDTPRASALRMPST